MNILVIAPHGMYHNYSSSYVHNQAKAFVKLGHQVRAIVPVAIGKRFGSGMRMWIGIHSEKQDGVEIFYVPHLSLSKYGAKQFNIDSAARSCRALGRKILQGFQPDIFHAHSVHFGGMVARSLQEYCNAPLVLTTHGSDTNVYIAENRQAVLQEFCDLADRVIACSPVLGEQLRKCGTTTAIGCIWNGFSVENIQKREKFRYRIIQVNTLVESKHTEYTIQAVKQLKDQYPDISLIIVGDGPEREKLEALCAEWELSERVSFLGQCSNLSAMEEMARAEVFCMPSYPEGFGIVYLEAMASGCVTIGTQGEGIDGVIVDGENGFLVPRDDVDAIVDTIDRCFREKERARRIADAGRTTAMGLTWENNARAYLELFESLKEEKSA